jgi:hypothetical protein
MRYCEDCGTGLWSNGRCPYCDEELIIYQDQIPEMDEPFKPSDEFMQKVEESKRKIQEREIK